MVTDTPTIKIREEVLELPPFRLIKPKRFSTPFVFASPHSGRHYPEYFIAQSQLKEKTLRRSEDAFVDLLIEGIEQWDVGVLIANYPRVYLDLNRDKRELDPSMFKDNLPENTLADSDRVIAGYGIIPRIVSLDLEIYGRKLTFAEEKLRIKHIYDPYHKALSQTLKEAKEQFGWAVLIDCHSMPSNKSPAFMRLSRKITGRCSGEPDIVLGDRYGKSCAHQLTDKLQDLFEKYGYSVTRNDPYAGGFCTVSYGKPAQSQHALQIEVNRRLYMNEESMELKPNGFKKIHRDLQEILAQVSEINLAPSMPLAAE